MARNAYVGLAMLSTHPAFSLRTGTLICPDCGELFTRTRAYDLHFLAHGPTAEHAERWLSWRTFRRKFPIAAGAALSGEPGT